MRESCVGVGLLPLLLYLCTRFWLVASCELGITST